MNNWKLEKLSNLCTKIGDGLHGTPTYVEDSNIYFINGNNLKNGKIEINKNTKCVSEEELNNNYIPLNDKSLLLSINGTLGSMAFYRNEKVMLGKSSAYLNFKTPINKFYYYYFQLPFVQEYFLNVATGSTIKNLSLKSIQDFEVPVPEFQEWNNIASVLSSLDSKIELNNRINAELEAMAKTLYDYWFVQFDFSIDADLATKMGNPNLTGKPYKSSGGKMVWNEELKREIPEGWEVEGIEKSCSIIDCLHSKKSDLIFEDENSFLLQLDNIKDDGLLDLKSKYYVTKEEYRRWTTRIEVKEDDILITNAGRVAATAQMPKGIVSGIGRNITAIRPNKICSTYLFLSFRGIDIKRQIRLNTDAGAFFTSFNVKGIKKLQILRPKNKIEERFEELVHPIRKKRELNNSENQKLTELRDWLLPMLMNGQVKVGDKNYGE
ncbi:MAG: restriction endonuclease subunit S [Bacteroidia bacterium]|nr:restriction endonuclease subunit S [Bacteroidia bacterium]